jgi:hypothetical protein
MVVGYNHNIKYKGEIFHIQTEDSGVNTPHIITLLYRGGNIIASKKTSYADIVKMDNLTHIVEELMKEQHKDMLRRLKNAEFDARLGLEGVEAEPAASPVTPPGAAPVPRPVPPPAAPPLPTAAPAPPVTAPPAVATETVPEAAPPVSAEQPAEASPKKKQSLDDIIFEFLSAGDDHK